ncbi:MULTISPECIES: hypothetical protein [unclassified Mesorhizobium]|nr:MULTISPECIES: hypothetical protein [unclassified Mesorhizobium]
MKPLAGLDRAKKGGVARLGLSHYTTTDEVDQAIEAVARLAV